MSQPHHQELSEEPFLVERPDGVKHPSSMHARAFLGLIRAGAALDRGLDAELRATHGLSLRGFEALLHLAAFSPSGSLRMNQLTAQAPLSQSRVSRLVAELESQGWVTRSAFEGDNRGVLVSITDRGLDKLRQAQDTHLAGLHTRLFAHLGWADTVTLATLTGTILAANQA
ncbi:MAG: MarR family winged helix-turn-helix transcriptional regulator [Actinomycetia bacterium]|nr:MarR family winged helix-turn-helix transcriptional regulator [Actinomycetes bacterium]